MGVNKENSEVTNDVNLKKYENINEHIDNIDNLEIETLCGSYDEKQINEDRSFIDEKKIQLKTY